MKSKEIRQKFFDFFKERNHTLVASSSLIPAQDPTLLFANAGMNQFKDLFLGNEKRSYKRAVSIQKCMRAGGKHNDLENVGFTKRHLTFFEMMGNFSFGDYFKEDAIQFAWDFLTKVMQFDAKTFHATVFTNDDEAYAIWHKQIGLPTSNIHRLGAADNFWQMGDTGPCGPCTEILIDRGADKGCLKPDCAPGCSCDRFLEVWNLVFMQFDRQPDGTDKPLKNTGVDTGMGLERLCAIVQDKDSVFLTDVFQPIIASIEELTGLTYNAQTADLKAAFHVLADHIRASTFLIADGCSPSNEGRGYVLRKIIRRAALFVQKLTDKNIFPELADTVIATMSDSYPELTTNRAAIKSLLKSEIEKFEANLHNGQHILTAYFKEHAKDALVTGKQAFILYDTYGFPLELTRVIAHEQGFTVDENGFNLCMEEQRKQSGKKTTDEHAQKIELPETITTIFTGYEHTQTDSVITALVVNGQLAKTVPTNQECWIIAQESPFFVECGGQISDQGWVTVNKQKTAVLELKKIGKAIAIKIKAPVELSVGMQITQSVDSALRKDTMNNHTATHLLQAALIELFGKQIKQAGSLVAPDYLRFDFTYHENLTPEQITQVEDKVNAKIRENIALKIENSTLRDATQRGVIAFFGDKYNPEDVRIVQVPGYSAELCGGTHVTATGDIGCFKITEVTALSAGQRRIVALTGPKAIAMFQESFNIVKTLSQEYKVQHAQVLEAVEKQREQIQELQSAIKKLKKDQWKALMPQWLTEVETVNTIPFLFVLLNDYSIAELKDSASALAAKKEGFYFFASNADDKGSFYAQCSPNLSSAINMQEFAQFLQKNAELRGGGKGTALQGGGPEIAPMLKDVIRKWIAQQPLTKK